jgi:hypothetical protein
MPNCKILQRPIDQIEWFFAMKFLAIVEWNLVANVTVKYKFIQLRYVPSLLMSPVIKSEIYSGTSQEGTLIV